MHYISRFKLSGKTSQKFPEQFQKFKVCSVGKEVNDYYSKTIAQD